MYTQIGIWYFNPKYVMNMKNYGWLVKYIKPYIPHFNRQKRCAF